YNTALLREASLTPPQRAEALTQLSRFTGLPVDYLDRAKLRVDVAKFAEALLRDEGRVVGRYDGRYKGYVQDRLATRMEYDPSAEAVFSAFNSTFNDYVRTELKFETDLVYELLTGAVNPWNWGGGNNYVNVADTLSQSLTRNSYLQIHVSNGYFDL